MAPSMRENALFPRLLQGVCTLSSSYFNRQPAVGTAPHFSRTTMSDSIHIDFAYLGEVLQSDLPDSAKLFFATLIVNTGFRAYFGFSLSDGKEHSGLINSIDQLEKAGFLTVVRDSDKIRYVAHRNCARALPDTTQIEHF
jgi:hypothetical protein